MDAIAATKRLLGTAPQEVRPDRRWRCVLVDLRTQTTALKPSTHGHLVLTEARAYEEVAASGVRVPLALAARTEPEVMVVDSGTAEIVARISELFA